MIELAFYLRLINLRSTSQKAQEASPIREGSEFFYRQRKAKEIRDRLQRLTDQFDTGLKQNCLKWANSGPVQI